MIREIQKTRIPNKQSSSFIFFRIDAFILRLIQRNCPSHPRVYPLPSAPRDSRQCVSSHRVRGLPRLASPRHMMAATAHHIVSYVYDLSSYGAIASLEKLVPRRSKRLSIGTVLPPFLPRFRLWGRRTSAAGHNVRLPAEGSRLAITPAGRGSKK
jgi:hypothetical protein